MDDWKMIVSFWGLPILRGELLNFWGVTHPSCETKGSLHFLLAKKCGEKVHDK